MFINSYVGKCTLLFDVNDPSKLLLNGGTLLFGVGSNGNGGILLGGPWTCDGTPGYSGNIWNSFCFSSFFANSSSNLFPVSPCLNSFEMLCFAVKLL